MATKSAARFRSITDLGGYVDPEPPGFRAPSKTDPSDYEPIERLVSRMTRGDLRLTQEVYDGIEDGEEAALAAMERMAPMEQDGFDRADAHRILQEGKEHLAGLKQEATRRSTAKQKRAPVAPAEAPREEDAHPAEPGRAGPPTAGVGAPPERESFPEGPAQ